MDIVLIGYGVVHTLYQNLFLSTRADVGYNRFRLGAFLVVLSIFYLDVYTAFCVFFDVIRKHRLIPKADISDNAIRTGLAEVIWPFRFERISEDPLVMIDGAHNADAARKLRQTIEERFDGYTIILVIGMFRDKEYDKVLGTLATIAGTVITTEAPGNPRALPAKDLAKAASIYCTDTVAAGSVSDAYDIAAAAYKTAGEKSVIIACGSFAYLADLRKCAEVQAGRKEW